MFVYIFIKWQAHNQTRPILVYIINMKIQAVGFQKS